MAQSNQELVVQIKADLSKLQKGLDGAEQKAKGFKARLAKIGKSLQGAFSFGAIFAGGALISNATKTIVEFEQGIANLAAVTGQSTEEVEGLKNEALRLGGATAFTANEVTQLQTELAKLGFREKDITNLTPAVLNLAQATGSDLANAAALAGSVVQSFGLKASDTTAVVDIMTKSFSASALDIHKFEVGIRQVAPVAKNAGVELSEVTAMLGLLANNGVRAETAGVGLRNIMLEAAKRGVPFKELLEQVNNSADKSATAMDLFGKENAAVGVILSKNIDAVRRLDTALQDSAGTAKQMADQQLNTLEGRITLLKSAWDGFILSIESGDGAIAASVNTMLKGVTQILTALTNLSASSELLNPFKSFEDYSKSTLDFLLQSGETDSGKSIATLLAPINAEIDKLTNAQKISQLGKFKEQFQQVFLDQGESLEDINILWQHYSTKIKQAAAKQHGIVDATNNTNTALTELDSKLEDNSNNVDEATESISNYKAVLLDTTKEVNKLGGALQNIGGDFGFEDRLIEQQISQMQQIQTIAGGIESAFNSMANSLIDSLGLAETGFQGFVKVLLQTVAQIISAIVAQSIATAIVNAMQSSQATGPAALFAQPAFIATALAGVGAALATIPAFASGGIVNGSSFSGDRVMARVNSGEMILNRGQQANLFSMINSGGGGNNGVLTAQIKGSDIWLSNNRAGKERRRYTGR